MSILFDQIKADLRTRLPASTFEELLLSAWAEEQAGGLTIHTTSEHARAILENRLHPLLLELAQAAAGRTVAINYVNGGSPAAAIVEAVEIQTDIPLAHFDLLKNNWVKHPRYLSLFYQPYFASFGQFAGSRALAVWQFIRDRLDDKKYDKAWTLPWEVRIRELARLTGTTSHRLSGVWRSCPVFQQALAETGQAPDCCERYGPVRRDETACRFWRPGILQLLAEHGLLIFQRTGRGSRTVKALLQVYRWPPLLTPWQMARLDEQAQATHALFLAELGVDMDEWRALGDLVNLMRAWFDPSGQEFISQHELSLNRFNSQHEISLNRLKKNFLPPIGVDLNSKGGDLEAD